MLLLPLEVYLFHPRPIGIASSLLGMASVIPAQSFLYPLPFLLEVWFQWKSHLVQTKSHIPLTML